jgi:ABC-type multidrug transport system permease subunit
VPTLGEIATKLMMINLTIALFNLVPFFTLLPIMMKQKSAQKAISAPYVEGEFIFFGAKTGWVFLFAFSVVLTICLLIFSATASLLLAFLMAILLFIAWHYFFEHERLSIMDEKSTSPSFRKYK